MWRQRTRCLPLLAVATTGLWNACGVCASCTELFVLASGQKPAVKAFYRPFSGEEVEQSRAKILQNCKIDSRRCLSVNHKLFTVLVVFIAFIYSKCICFVAQHLSADSRVGRVFFVCVSPKVDPSKALVAELLAKARYHRISAYCQDNLVSCRIMFLLYLANRRSYFSSEHILHCGPTCE